MLLKLENVSKIYRMDSLKIQVLKGINLNVREGEYLAIVGPSGSGKSTLMHLIGLLDRPTEGKISIHDQDISQLSDNSLAVMRNREVGFVFQSFNLLARTSALDNVELPLIYSGVSRNERRRRTITMLEEVGLKHRLNNTPGQLSGGEQQRVAIARALVNNPLFILADEPTGNLDTKTGSEIMDLINKLNQEGKTILVVTHDPSVARHARRRIKLIDGEIVEDTAN